jgi:DNA repair protein RecO (recombination protein O)
MALVRTESVILKSTNYSETSKVFRLYTLSYGLQSVIAKGVRRPGSKLSGVLETLNHVEIVYYKKPNKSLFTLSQAAPIETFSGISSDIHRFYRAAAIAEMVLRLGTEEDGNEQIFRLLIHSLKSFSRRPITSLGGRMISYLWGILSLLGYAPRLESCACCGTSLTREGHISFSIMEGGALCENCKTGAGSESFRISEKMLHVLAPNEAGGLVGLSDSEEKVLMRLTEEYVHFHVHDQKPLVCWDFLRTLQV